MRGEDRLNTPGRDSVTDFWCERSDPLIEHSWIGADAHAIHRAAVTAGDPGHRAFDRTSIMRCLMKNRGRRMETKNPMNLHTG